MYYRRKVLLALLQAFNNELEKLLLQKLLFLVTRKQADKAYEFVPYKYGCYSFQAASDLNTLKKYNNITESDNSYRNISQEDFLSQLKIEDRSAILQVKTLYSSKTNDELTRSTYLSYPYFAINSIMAERLLTDEQLEKVKRNRPVKHTPTLFTIGYEGKTLEAYLNKLIINDVRLLCDVRNNPLSMKFGFSKSQLQRSCESVGIKYVHIPEVGIKSEKRQELNTQSDYNKLFHDYKDSTLKSTLHIQKYILSLLADHKRIALTCFEANVCQCHRKPLAEAIAKLPGWQYDLSHI
jgi:uncharacterized protein (DUF488 family)